MYQSIIRALKKWFIQDKNYHDDDQGRLQRYFYMTPEGPAYYNHLDIKEFNAFMEQNARFTGRPIKTVNTEPYRPQIPENQTVSSPDELTAETSTQPTTQESQS
jgi:hypothetical protein